MNVTGMGFWNFLTAGTRLNPNVPAKGPDGGGGLTHMDQITLQEIIGGLNIGASGGGYGSLGATSNPMTTMGNNTMRNILPMVFSLAGLKVFDKVLTKVGFTRSFNRLAKQVGVNNMVRA